MPEEQDNYAQVSCSTLKQILEEKCSYTNSIDKNRPFEEDTSISFRPPFKETLDAVTMENDDGTKILNQYLIKQEIGRGSFARVNCCIDTLTGKEYAIKEFSKFRLRKKYECSRFSPPDLELFSFKNNHVPFYRNVNDDHTKNDNPLSFILEEITIMKKINHKNIVSIIEVLDDPRGDSLYMVLEMCKRGVLMNVGLNKVVNPYSETECRKWFRDLILGIEYLHAHGICHCDIKPENLLLSRDGVLKIADFGIAKMFIKDDDTFHKIKGTPEFMAPELCFFGQNIVSCKAADIWSMGVTLWCLVFGSLPFNDPDIMKLYDIIKTQKITIPNHVLPSLRDLFEKILEKDPDKRIKMHDLRQHDWVTLGGKDPMISYEENTMYMVKKIIKKDFDTAVSTVRKTVSMIKVIHALKSMSC